MCHGCNEVAFGRGEFAIYEGECEHLVKLLFSFDGVLRDEVCVFVGAREHNVETIERYVIFKSYFGERHAFYILNFTIGSGEGDEVSEVFELDRIHCTYII